MKAPKIDGANTGDLMVADDADQYDSPAILAKTAARLKELGGNPAPVIETEPQETEDDSEDNSTLTPVNQEDDNASAEENEEDDNNEGDADEESAIPDNLFRAATHNGWKKEQIVKFWKSDPELAETTLGKMHEDQVSVNTQYAEQGRAAKQLQADRTALDANRVIVEQKPKPKSFVDMEKAREEFGDGAAAVIEQLNNALVQITERSEPIQQGAVQQEDSVVKRELSLTLLQSMSQWFANPALKPYAEYYGAGTDSNGFPMITTDHLTAEQAAHREVLLDMAGDIDAGIKLRGGTLSVADALNNAHLVVTKDIQTEIIRKGIMNTAKKRAKGVTLRSSNIKSKPAVKLKPGEKQSEKDILLRTERRVKNLLAGKPLEG